MIKIDISSAFYREQSYIIGVIFKEFLGLDYGLEVTSNPKTVIRLENKELTLANSLFQINEKFWLTEDSLPKRPLKHWDIPNILNGSMLAGKIIPVIFGGSPNEPGFYVINKNKISLKLDIFGSSFFMLIR
jgi:hypothetical protein